MDKKKHWMGKPILDSQHHGELEMKAAVHQFGNKLPKEQAEEKAYSDYTRSHSEEAAAHHLMGIKQAIAAKDKEGARQHGLMYHKHMQNLGLDPMSTPPENILRLVKEPEASYKFKPHKADVLMYSDPLGKSLFKAVPGAIARLGRAIFGRPENPKFAILPKGAADASAAAPAPSLPQMTPQTKPSKLQSELTPAVPGIHSQSPAEIMGFHGNPMKESGRQVIGRLKDELGKERTGTKHKVLRPAKLIPKLATRQPKDRNKIIDQGLSALREEKKGIG